MKSIFIIGYILQFIGSSLQSCSVSPSERKDCGYIGINQQQCVNKGCCWQPTLHDYENDAPWCFYPANDNCDNLNLKSDTPGFDDQWYQGMNSNFEKNMMRDAALTMRTYLEINDYDLSKVQTKFKHYVEWVLAVQNEFDPNQIDIRIEPKFNLNDRSAFSEGWCRPQTDGPALRATALIMFANVLLDAKQDQYVTEFLWTSGAYNGGAIKFDLQWVVQNWQQDGCDLWEEVRSNDFFWNRMAFRYALDLASKFAQRMGDQQAAGQYTSVASQIKNTLDGHWNGNYMYEMVSRPKDSSVIHAFTSFEGVYPMSSDKIAKTIQLQIPGIMHGRYEGDNYQGGNPWQLLSASLAEVFYKTANEFQLLHQKQVKIDEQSVQAWSKLLNIGQNSNYQMLAESAKEAGDSILFRVFTHVKNDNYRIDEQISNDDGQQKSAKGLTWSYANILHALHYRNSKLQRLHQIE